MSSGEDSDCAETDLESDDPLSEEEVQIISSDDEDGNSGVPKIPNFPRPQPLPEPPYLPEKIVCSIPLKLVSSPPSDSINQREEDVHSSSGSEENLNPFDGFKRLNLEKDWGHPMFDFYEFWWFNCPPDHPFERFVDFLKRKGWDETSDTPGGQSTSTSLSVDNRGQQNVTQMDTMAASAPNIKGDIIQSHETSENDTNKNAAEIEPSTSTGIKRKARSPSESVSESQVVPPKRIRKTTVYKGSLQTDVTQWMVLETSPKTIKRRKRSKKDKELKRLPGNLKDGVLELRSKKCPKLQGELTLKFMHQEDYDVKYWKWQDEVFSETCEYCQETFDQEAKYHYHTPCYEALYQKQMKDKKMLYDPEYQYTCPTCGKHLKDIEALVGHATFKHFRPRTSGPNIICTYPNCTQVSRSTGTAKTHCLQHTGVEPFGCKWPKCSKKFKQMANLKTHIMYRHLKVKCHKCTVDGCEAAFCNQYYMHQHLKSHADHPLKQEVTYVLKSKKEQEETKKRREEMEEKKRKEKEEGEITPDSDEDHKNTVPEPEKSKPERSTSLQKDDDHGISYYKTLCQMIVEKKVLVENLNAPLIKTDDGRYERTVILVKSDGTRKLYTGIQSSETRLLDEIAYRILRDTKLLKGNEDNDTPSSRPEKVSQSVMTNGDGCLLNDNRGKGSSSHVSVTHGDTDSSDTDDGSELPSHYSYLCKMIRKKKIRVKNLKAPFIKTSDGFYELTVYLVRSETEIPYGSTARSKMEVLNKICYDILFDTCLIYDYNEYYRKKYEAQKKPYGSSAGSKKVSQSISFDGMLTSNPGKGSSSHVDVADTIPKTTEEVLHDTTTPHVCYSHVSIKYCYRFLSKLITENRFKVENRCKFQHTEDGWICTSTLVTPDGSREDFTATAVSRKKVTLIISQLILVRLGLMEDYIQDFPNLMSHDRKRRKQQKKKL